LFTQTEGSGFFMVKISVIICILNLFFLQFTANAKLLNSTKSLFVAVVEKNIEDVQSSLAAGANVNALNKNGETPAGVAINKGYFKIAHLILRSRNQIGLGKRNYPVNGKSQKNSPSDRYSEPSPTSLNISNKLSNGVPPSLTKISKNTTVESVEKRGSRKSATNDILSTEGTAQNNKTLTLMDKKKDLRDKQSQTLGQKKTYVNKQKSSTAMDLKAGSNQPRILNLAVPKSDKSFFSMLQNILSKLKNGEVSSSSKVSIAKQLDNKIISKPNAAVSTEILLEKKIPVVADNFKSESIDSINGVITLASGGGSLSTEDSFNEPKSRLDRQSSTKTNNQSTNMSVDAAINPNLKNFPGRAGKVQNRLRKPKPNVSFSSLSDVNFLSADFKLGRNLSFKKSGEKKCFQKYDKSTLYCIENISLPDDLLTKFEFDSSEHRSRSMIVRYNNKVSVRALVYFPSKNFSEIHKILKLRFGVDGEVKQHLLNQVARFQKVPILNLSLDTIFGIPNPKFNSIVKWDNKRLSVINAPVLELRRYDDVTDNMTNLKQGVLRLYYKNTLPIFHYISVADIVEQKK
jgi:hypothetical protein